MVDVIIIGGGIGGLAAAIALQQRSIAAHVFESAPQLREIGAGIWVPTNAMQVLHRLTLAPAVQQDGLALERIEVRDFQRGRLQAIDLHTITTRYGFTTIAIHRTRPQALLARALADGTLHFGKTCQRITQEADQVWVHVADGSAAAAPVIVAADGIRSVVRRQIFPAAQLRYSGQSSYRAPVPYTLPPDLERTAWEVWGKGCRFGFSGLGGDEVYWYATLDAPPRQQDAPGQIKGRIQALAAPFPHPIPEMVAATEEARLVRTDQYDLRPLRSWHQGRVVLVGDAAHAPAPNLGQGGAQAIEDAYVLAESLARHAQPAAAFQAYERVRMAKATMVAQRAWQMGKVAHLQHPVARAVRNLVVSHTPEVVRRKQLDALYALNY